MIMVGQSKRLREPLSGGQRRALYATLGGLLAVVVALAAYGAVAHDAATTSGHGCVNVTVASTTGGGILHECGRAAKRWCRMESLSHGALASLARPQCRLAGYPFGSAGSSEGTKSSAAELMQ
jgi:hypothetical protein